jgi:hypothetical protein
VGETMTEEALAAMRSRASEVPGLSAELDRLRWELAVAKGEATAGAQCLAEMQRGVTENTRLVERCVDLGALLDDALRVGQEECERLRAERDELLRQRDHDLYRDPDLTDPNGPVPADPDDLRLGFCRLRWRLHHLDRKLSAFDTLAKTYRIDPSAANAELVVNRACSDFEARLAAESLREANAGLRRELDTARAILAGRSTPPTDAEIEAHDAAGGSWLTNRGVVGLGFSEVLEIEFPGGSILTGQRVEDVALGIEWWIALDAHGRPCAWPVVGVPRG